ncbi:hypothetical protein CRUP_030986 [Coryphaenoides rupestris]|nr:hypothetical protein CRUP_030986 [Coryphaenoides rupestris]
MAEYVQKSQWNLWWRKRRRNSRPSRPSVYDLTAWRGAPGGLRGGRQGWWLEVVPGGELPQCRGETVALGDVPWPWYLSRACFSQNISSPAQKWPRILRLRPHSVQLVCGDG